MSKPRIKVAKRPLIPSILTFLYPFLQPGVFMWALDKRGPNIPYQSAPKQAPRCPSPTASAEGMENTFIDALVRACSCRQQTRTSPATKPLTGSLFTYHKGRRRNLHSSSRQRGNSGGTRLYPQSRTSDPIISRDDYRQMLDYYHEPYDASTLPGTHGVLPLFELPTLHFDGDKALNKRADNPQIQPDENQGSEPRREQAAVASVSQAELVGSRTHHPVALPGKGFIQQEALSLEEAESSQSILGDRPATKHQQNVERLERLLHDKTSSHEQIYEAYLQLPSPGVAHLTSPTRHLLLHRLSVIEIKNRNAMLRYMNLVDHMKEASIPLNRSEWNTAIAYAGRCLVHIEASEVEFALRIWKEMEQEARVQSGSITFNILFDTATKAGKYVLAEMILKEMKARELKFTRFSHVGLIYYHGLKGDGAEVRRAYRDFVEAGQIVDTVVLNCVIASLIRAGELPAAEHVYQRMKRLLYEKTDRPVPGSGWKYSRDLGRALDRFSQTTRKDDERVRQLQAEQWLAPDLRTFSIFIDHHVNSTGELRCVAALLEEMQILRVPVHGRIFVKVFKGFACHGGVKYTSWTGQRLETVWLSLLSALDQGIEGVHLMKWMIVWVVRAFAKCWGRDRTLQIWEQIRDRWSISGEDEKVIIGLLRSVLETTREEDKL